MCDIYTFRVLGKEWTSAELQAQRLFHLFLGFHGIEVRPNADPYQSSFQHHTADPYANTYPTSSYSGKSVNTAVSAALTEDHDDVCKNQHWHQENPKQEGLQEQSWNNFIKHGFQIAVSLSI